MRIEARHLRAGRDLPPVLRALLFVAECSEESAMIDEAFGKTILDDDGLIAKITVEVEVRLSDGYGEHYILIKTPNAAPVPTPVEHCPTG